MDPLTLLKKHGLRSTPLRKALLKIFKSAQEPLSVPELQKELKKIKSSPNKTSLYREMQTFIELNIVEKIQVFKGVQSYELKRKNAHHHHFICEACKNILDFADEELEYILISISRRLKRKHHQVHSHHLNFYGRCSSCQ